MKKIIYLLIIILIISCLGELQHPLDIRKIEGIYLRCLLIPKSYDFCDELLGLNQNNEEEFNEEEFNEEESNGNLDTTFGSGGIVYIPYSTGNNQDDLKNLILQPDQKIILGGKTNNKLFLARLNPNGSFDTTFGTGGIVIYDITTGFPSSSQEIIKDLILTSDNKIVVTGTATPGSINRHFIAKFDSDGSNLGLSVYGGGGTYFGNAIDIQTIGSNTYYIVGVYGSSIAGNYNFKIFRYKEDLSPDTTFGSSGVADIELGSNQDSLQDLIIQPDNNIIAGGSWDPSGTNPINIALIRYLNNGTNFDTSFNSTGKVLYNNTTDSSIYNIKLQPDGKILIASYKSNGTNKDYYLARYNPDGTIDTNFGINGEIIEDFGLEDVATKIAIQSNGKILLGGNSEVAANQYQLLIIRYNPDGTKDTSFGTNGIFTYDKNTNDNDWLTGLAIQKDQGKEKIIVGATTDTDSGPPLKIDFYILRIE
ncbi:MAG: hypothetical protein KatS3mg129_2195 [Leptospiraceae bacterium]|nr:MAG: hypothetical protein KatS3mg129_2195 [Leptospiraceae bacterium]